MLIYYIFFLIANIRSREDTYGIVAKKIINNLDQLRHYNISEISEISDSSNATISRLARLLAMENFNELSFELKNLKSSYLNLGQMNQLPLSSSEKSIDGLNNTMIDTIHKTSKYNDYTLYMNAVKNILNSNHIVFAGSPMPQAVQMIQIELHNIGITSSAFFAPQDQLNEIKASTEGNIVILFDNVFQETVTTDVINVVPKHNKLILISPVTNRKKLFHPDFFFFYQTYNFPMDVFSMNVICNQLLGVLQNFRD